MRKLPSPKRGGRLRRVLLKPANAVALVALLMALASTASAAIMITGMNVRNGTLTGADVTNGSLRLLDFAPTARSAMRGPKGNRGLTGPAGAKGPTGANGPQGAPGAPARVASKWAWFESEYVNTSGSNDGAASWPSYNSGNVSAGNFQWANTINRPYETVLDLNTPGCGEGDIQGTHCAWGDNNGGGITVSWNSNLTAVATLKVLHLEASPVHTRLQCFLASNSGNGTDYVRMGSKTSYSAYSDDQIETMTIVGSTNKSTSAPIEYMVRAECRDADGTNAENRYVILAGSLSVVATERG